MFAHALAAGVVLVLPSDGGASGCRHTVARVIGISVGAVPNNTGECVAVGVILTRYTAKAIARQSVAPSDVMIIVVLNFDGAVEDELGAIASTVVEKGAKAGPRSGTTVETRRILAVCKAVEIVIRKLLLSSPG